MQRRRLGRSDVEVSAVGLGTWQVLDVRGREQEEARHEVVRAALDAGITLFDSSPMYGEAERVLGDALMKYGRNRATMATKVWTSDDREAERQIQDALSFFDGRVELYQVHNLVAVEKRLDMLEELKSEGKVRSVGGDTLLACGLSSADGRDAWGADRLRAGSVQRRRHGSDAGSPAARRGARTRRDRDGPPG
jgi:aryl-alcohol dehydrogenase-like predicted oxidoreductase